MPLFQRRHYDRLAYWAGRNLDLNTLPSLLDFLADDNPAFQKSRFIDACKSHRVLADHAKTGYGATHPKPIEANLDPITKATSDAHRRQAADIELTAALRASGFGNKTNSNSD